MKNNKTALIAFFGAALLLLGACQQGPKKEEPTEPEEVLPPEGIISLEESKSLYDNYTKHRLDIIKEYEMERYPDRMHIPARFSSFSYAEIKQYMAFVEQEAKEAGVKVESLRLYFANYPDKPDFPDGKKVVHPRQNSIFIVPTMNVNGQEYGFYIGADGKAKLIKDALGTGIGSRKAKSKSYANMIPTNIQDEDQSLTLDRSTSGPPPNGDY